MSSKRISLLKLIDLAIGFPVPGSVSFNLLHKVLYLLALRDGFVSAELDEIELTAGSGIVDLVSKGQNITPENISQTRLTVQRILNGASDEHTLKITGSRIILANNVREKPSAAGNDAKQMESRISAMSSVVSELEEKLQEMSHQKLGDECAKTLEQLQKRIEILEGLVEQQTSKVTIDEALQTEEHSPEVKAVDDHGNDAPDDSNGLKSMENISVQPSTDNFSDEMSKIMEYLRDIQQKHVQLEEDFQNFKNRHSRIDLQRTPQADVDFNNASLEPIIKRLQSVEQVTTSRFSKMENLINRLFQEKANDIDIESRVRQSVQIATKSSSLLTATECIEKEMIEQTNQFLQNQLSQLSELLQDSQNEIAALRNALDTKVNIDSLLPVTTAINDELRQLTLEMKSLPRGIRAETENNSAAGTKVNTIQNVCCISCDRPAQMVRCTEVLPMPPQAPGVSRAVKPTLRYRLEEIRRGFKQQPGNSVRNLERFEDIYRQLANAKHGSTK
ncbi:glutamine-rich protein 2-like [Sabethes cyaneus]|uniref:glutamine-rich protein 2-like n=1 Tax=Sabethes cyaneus TaxID=53552 RepID=UPI00237E1612|nr:glutamine-rich protein 2-like [Sabethes cyaneus]